MESREGEMEEGRKEEWKGKKESLKESEEQSHVQFPENCSEMTCHLHTSKHKLMKCEERRMEYIN